MWAEVESADLGLAASVGHGTVLVREGGAFQAAGTLLAIELPP